MLTCSCSLPHIYKLLNDYVVIVVIEFSLSLSLFAQLILGTTSRKTVKVIMSYGSQQSSTGLYNFKLQSPDDNFSQKQNSSADQQFTARSR